MSNNTFYCNGKKVNDIQDLRENFNLKDVYEGYRDGSLVNWLRMNNYEREYIQVEGLTFKGYEDTCRKLCNIFKVSYEKQVQAKSVNRENSDIDICLIFQIAEKLNININNRKINDILKNILIVIEDRQEQINSAPAKIEENYGDDEATIDHRLLRQRGYGQGMGHYAVNGREVSKEEFEEIKKSLESFFG
ncbi:MAG: hypothetical protein MJ050_01355 [Phascolarctobacterium sp.]|nr:hypothetical protein [Phascolarctobacterium sp.]